MIVGVISEECGLQRGKFGLCCSLYMEIVYNFFQKYFFVPLSLKVKRCI